jgi:UDP-glucuronate 4-epimerase
VHVALTGAAGFIGSHTVERLVARGHRVTGLDGFATAPYPAEPKLRNAQMLRGLATEALTLISGDIRDPAAIASLITPDVDVVCHLAALAGVRPSLEQPLRYLDVNIVGTGVIVERMREVGCKRLTFASSSSVYGVRPDASGAFREEDPCLTPASPYAATKRMNELQLSAYRDLYELGVHALRFFTVYGPRQRTDMAISKFLGAMLDKRPLTLFGDGSSARDYTFIADIVEGVVASIESVQPSEYEIMNIGGTATTSLRELIRTIEQITGESAVIEWLPNQAGDVPLTFADVSRARARLGYAPRTSLADGIARQWDWFKDDRSRSR